MAKTFYVIRSGWNAANQSSVGGKKNPKTDFESRRYRLVGIVEAETEEQAIEAVNCTVYNNQHVWAETRPRAIKGLTAAIREFNQEISQV